MIGIIALPRRDHYLVRVWSQLRLRLTAVIVTICLLCFSSPLQVAQQQKHLSGVDSKIDWLKTAMTGPETEVALSQEKDHRFLLHSIEIDKASGGATGLHLVWIVLPRGSFSLSINLIDKIGPANDLYTIATSSGALLTLNGGFYMLRQGRAPAPLGLLRQNGKTLSPLATFSTGAVLVSNDQHEVEIIPIKRFSGGGGVHNALQSKPLLIEDGRLSIRPNKSDGLFNRVAIGVTENGDLCIAGAFKDDTQAITLYDFGRFLSLLRAKKGLPLRTVLNLDGATDAHMFLPATGLQLGYPGTNYVPDVITISRK